MCVCVCERDIAVFGNREYRGVAGTNKQQTATATTGFVECRQLLVLIVQKNSKYGRFNLIGSCKTLRQKVENVQLFLFPRGFIFIIIASHFTESNYCACTRVVGN